MMKRSNTLSLPIASLIVAIALLIVLISGWHLEITSRYPLSDLPTVDTKVIEKQIDEKNLSRSEALFYRKIYAGSDTSKTR